MSDTMLLGVLRMPPTCWSRDAMDVAQRHQRYLQAAARIESDAAEIARLRAELRKAQQQIDANLPAKKAAQLLAEGI